MSHAGISVIVVAGGMGHRLGAPLPKALVQVGGKTLVEHAVANAIAIADEVVVTAPAGFEDQYRALLGDEVKVLTAGILRSDSVRVGLANVSGEFILVHDAARALATPAMMQRVVDALKSGAKAVIPALPVVDTIKVIDGDGNVASTPSRESLRVAQTPQGFVQEVLRLAHSKGEDASDCASMVEGHGIKVHTVLGEDLAMKITHPADLVTAERLLFGDSTKKVRVGIGTDAHAFSADTSRPLHLAGLHWPDQIGVDGHSDGDVAAHAICDALLSAAELGDLGSNYGVAEPEWAGASGAKLLQETLRRITDAGYSINNVSVQIVGNRPKIGPRRKEAIAALSSALGGAPVSVAATSTDGLGFTGEGKGISAIASALLVGQR